MVIENEYNFLFYKNGKYISNKYFYPKWKKKIDCDSKHDWLVCYVNLKEKFFTH